MPRTTATGAAPTRSRAIPTSSSAGVDSQKAPGAAPARRAASAGASASGGERDHACVRGCASAAERKSRMYCAIETTDTTVEM